MTEFWLLLAPTEPTECSVLSENLYVVGPRLYTTAGLSDRTPAWALHIIEFTAPAPLLQARARRRRRAATRSGLGLSLIHISEPTRPY